MHSVVEEPTKERDESRPLNAAYKLAALDQDFILGDSTRGVRFLLEYAKAEEYLRKWGIASMVVVFGSSHPVSAPEIASVGAATSGAVRKQRTRAAWWYEQARLFGRIVSERGGALQPRSGVRHNVIATGGGPGIMEAANRGASDVGAPSIGFNIRLPTEQKPNGYSAPELTFQFHYFAMRKMHLAMKAAALVVFPGGFGTLDELFEFLTLIQTGKAPKIPIICFDNSYWTRIINFEALADQGMIRSADLQLFDFANTANDAWQKIEASWIKANRRL